MKKALLLFLLFNSLSYCQKITQEDDVKQTIDWLNKKFQENIKWRTYEIDEEIILNMNEPTLIIYAIPGDCGEIDTIFIPLTKVSGLNYELLSIRDEKDTYELTFQSNEKIIWQLTKNCGQIGNKSSLHLNPSVEKNDTKDKIKQAFYHLMILYGNKLIK
ncbi:MAG TPA: hypothetical protein PKH91_09345 [Flavobacterium sp.]|nr:hypothetical protein [Flavobacterium sp.]